MKLVAAAAPVFSLRASGVDVAETYCVVVRMLVTWAVGRRATLALCATPVSCRKK